MTFRPSERREERRRLGLTGEIQLIGDSLAVHLDSELSLAHINLISTLPELLVGEPIEYRVLFRLSDDGRRFAGVQRLIGDESGGYWQECDLDTSYLILTALADYLSILARGRIC